MTPTQVIALICFALGAVVAAGFYYIWPHAHWVVYLVIVLFVAGSLYPQLLRIKADERVVDRDVTRK